MRRMSRGNDVGDHRLAKGTTRRVLGYAQPFSGTIVLFLVVTILMAALAVTPPLLFKEIIDQGVLTGNKKLVIQLALVVALVALVQAAMQLVNRWCSARIGEGLINHLRVEVFDHVQAQPLAFFTRAQTGKLVSRLNSDIIGAQQAFTSTLSQVVSNVFSLVLVLGAMVVLSPALTALALVMVPLFLIPARYVGRRLAGLTREQMQHNADLNATMTERFAVSGALLVKLFGRRSEEKAMFARRAAAVRDVSMKIALNGRFFMTSLTLLAALATALVYGLGGVFAIDGALTVGTLTALAGLLTQLYGPLTQLTNARVDVMSALVSFERVFEILDLEPAVRDPDQPVTVTGALDIEFDAVHFSYPRAEDVSLASLEVASVPETAGQEVLSGVSFRIEPGQTVALVGLSGGGKTTITHLLARLYDVDSGAVRVGGVDVRQWAMDDLHARVGYVTQDAHMFHDTIRANLLYARPDATEEQLWQALDAGQIGSLVRRLADGLDTVVGERGYRLSGGERQRLAIARLLLKAPDVVVLDEATAHLDSESEAAVQRALDEAMTDRTSLVIAHRLSTVRDADQILVIADGRVVQHGRHEELLASDGLYSELHRTQFR